MVAAIEQGYPQREIQRTAYAYQLEIERKERLDRRPERVHAGRGRRSR